MTVQTVTHITIYDDSDDATFFVNRDSEEDEPSISITSYGLKNCYTGVPDEISLSFNVEFAVALANAILRQVEFINNDE